MLMMLAGIVNTYFQLASQSKCMKNSITSSALQHDTAIMTDVFVPRGDTASPAPGAIAIYAGPITIPHPVLPASHLKPGQIYSAGLNVLTIDGSVQWLQHRETTTTDKTSAAFRWDVRPRYRYPHGGGYQNMYW